MSAEWHPEEDKIIMNNLDTIDIEVCKQLPDRSIDEIKSRARSLKRKIGRKKKRVELWDTILYHHIFGMDTKVPESFKDNLDKVYKRIIIDNPSNTDKYKRLLSVMDMYYKEGLTYEEVSLKIGVTSARVRVIINEVIRIFRYHPIYRYMLDHAEPEDEFDFSANPSFAKMECLNLSYRACTSLKRKGINTIDQLACMSKKDLVYYINNIGMKTANEIEDALNKRGIKLQD